MQSCFRVSEMDSTNEPPSPMAAPASAKRMFRNCTNCTNRMPSIDFDAHTLCIGCRRKVCDMSVHCDECRDWTDSYRAVPPDPDTLTWLGGLRLAAVSC